MLVVMHHNDMWAACLKVMGRYFNSGYRDTIPRAFRISERGFDIHDDDLIMPIDELLGMSIEDQERHAKAWFKQELNDDG